MPATAAATVAGSGPCDGLEGKACVRIEQSVDAMLVFSTACYLAALRPPGRITELGDRE